MTTGNTTLLGLALPVEGELDGTWGDVVNDSITSLVDSAVAGTTTLSTDADVTLTTTVLAANQARQAVILWTASNGATTRNITAPAQSKPYIVINAGTGSIVLRGAGPTTGITIVAAEKCLAAWNGSDFVKIASTAASNITGTLPVANGGTGASTLTANNVILGNGTSAVQFVAPSTNGNVLTSNGTSWTSSPAAATGVTSLSVATANGFAGTSSGGSTPILTMTTSITGLLQGNGTAISAVTIGSGLSFSAGTLSASSATSVGLVRAIAINCILP
jgi:hypothetical protein